MRRGFDEMVADFLLEAKTKRAAKTRIAAHCSLNNNFTDIIVNAGLMVENPNKIVEITEKGMEFLHHFQALQKLCPKPKYTEKTRHSLE